MTGINLPPALAARRAELVKHEEELRTDAAQCEEEAAGYRTDADRCQSEIAGIDAAAEAFAELLAEATGNRVAQPAPIALGGLGDMGGPATRRKRRNVRGMVLDELRAREPLACTESELTKILPGVRAEQVGKALEYHEAVGRICHKDGHWRIIPEQPAAGETGDELALGAAG